MASKRKQSSSASNQSNKRANNRANKRARREDTTPVLATSLQDNTARERKTLLDNGYFPLLHFPPEVLENVAEHLPASSLQSFRLVCKCIDKIVRDPLHERALFGEKMWYPSDQESMEDLLRISQRKDLVKKYVRHIRLSSLFFWRDGGSLGSPSWRLEAHPTEELNMINWPTNRFANHMPTAQDQMELDQCTFIREDLANILVSIFTNLRRWNCRPSISIHPSVSEAEDPSRARDLPLRGMDKWRQIDRSDSIWASTDCLYHIPIYRAIVKSGLATEELDIGSWDNEFPISEFSYRPQEFPGEHLRVLRLSTLR